MDVDEDKDLHLYDEHRDVRGVAREVITMETKIKSNNKGFAMLAKMGWSEGQPLGLSGDGMHYIRLVSHYVDAH
jgi:Wiskott-Aldrich syndrome protein